MKRLIAFIISAEMMLVIQLPLSTPARAQEADSECWAVIVGVSDYKRVDDLNFADDGALELYEQLYPV